MCFSLLCGMEISDLVPLSSDNIVCLSSLVSFSLLTVSHSLLLSLSSLPSLISLHQSPFTATFNQMNVMVSKVSVHFVCACDICNTCKKLIGLPIIFYYPPSAHTMLITLASTIIQCGACSGSPLLLYSFL